MSTEAEQDSHLEIGHVLFLDIVGYSKLLITEQSELLRKLTAAEAAYQRAVQELTQILNTVDKNAGLIAEQHSLLGVGYAGLGDAPRAVSEGQKGMALQPTSEDPFEGPLREEQMAHIYALLGNANETIPILQRWIQVPSATSITRALLRIDPIWDPIRNDPRFQELVAKKKP
jgi:hypothetical protein